MKLGLIYNISKYLGFTRLLLGFPEAFLILGDKKIYFNNYNSAGIFTKAYVEALSKVNIYKECDCYIDVGAHMGDKSFWFHEYNKEAEVAVFEPNPVMFGLLELNLRHIKGLRKYCVALGSEEGEINIYSDPMHLDTASLNESSYYLKNNAEGELQSTKVKVKRLDSYIDEFKNKQNIYLKIDVETFERELLKGAQEFIKNVKYLEIEVSQDDHNHFSEIFSLIPREFNLLECDVLRSKNLTFPRVATLLLELK